MANVLSEPTKAAPDRNALARLKRHERDIAIEPSFWESSASASCYCRREDVDCG